MQKNRTIGVGGVLFMLTAAAGWAAADEFYATVQKIENGKVTFAKKEVGKGAKGKGGKKGGTMTTVPAASDIYVTTATYVRRTADFRIGIPLGGGLKNSAIKNLPGSRTTDVPTCQPRNATDRRGRNRRQRHPGVTLSGQRRC